MVTPSRPVKRMREKRRKTLYNVKGVRKTAGGRKIVLSAELPILPKEAALKATKPPHPVVVKRMRSSEEHQFKAKEIVTQTAQPFTSIQKHSGAKKKVIRDGIQA